LLPRLGSFIRQYPDVDLDVRAGSALADFQRDDVDVAIRWGLGQWPGVKAEELLRVPSDLARHTLLRSDDEFWKPWFDAVGLDWPEPERGPIFNDSSLMLQAAVEVQ